MKRFDFTNPTTAKDASSVLKKENAAVLAGGSDIVGALKADIYPSPPEKVVSLKNIEGLNYIEEDAEGLKIGAMITLEDIVDSDIVKSKWNAVSEAAFSVASFGIRSIATLGGNLCQDVRCWYYRYPHAIGDRVDCLRKEGGLCSAMMGDNRYHSIFGGCKAGDSPCTCECPAGTNIPAYLKKLRDGDTEGAARVIMQVNPMPAITSRICAHFCQEKCNREEYDETMNIGAIERYVGDYILDNPDKFMTPPRKENGKSVVIVGSGPAGLAAAFYLRQSGYKVTILERMEKAGGALMYAIPAFRLPKKIVERFTKSLENMGVEIKYNTEVGSEGIPMSELQNKYDSVILDTGTWKRPLIGISGEELTRFGLDFLVDVNNYMHERPGANVVVVGGGNVAVDVAVTAQRLGAKKVSMVCLECSDEEMPAGQEEIDRVRDAGIELVNGWGPTQILKNEKGVSGIEFKECIRVFDDDGKFNPQYDESKLKSFDADVVFMAVGQVADLDFLEGVTKVETERGRIKVTEGNATNVPGVFAGGDVTTGPATVIEAVAAGKGSAVQVNEYMNLEPLLIENAEAADEEFLKFNPDYKDLVKYHKADEIPVEQQSIDKEDMLGLDYDKVIAEAERCLNCGCVAVNPSDMANILVALGATVKTNMRSFGIEELYSNVKIDEVLRKGEIILEVSIPKPGKDTISKYYKYRLRGSIDFAICSVAWACATEDGKITDAKLVLGAAAPIPYRAKAAEEFLIGKKPDEQTAEKAAEIALDDALPLPKNEYKIDMFKAFIKRTIAQ